VPVDMHEPSSSRAAYRTNNPREPYSDRQLLPEIDPLAEYCALCLTIPVRMYWHGPTIFVLMVSGYEVAHVGENGFVCLGMRGWTAPTHTPKQFRDFTYDASIRAPICFRSGGRQNPWVPMLRVGKHPAGAVRLPS
jgi:hypothetical protein